jgi:hypothetical protein
VDSHIMDDHFDRELRRRQLARRLVAHQARTQTICDLTALTRHQLATLRQRWRVAPETRHRGPSPKSFAVFSSSSRVRSEAAALAALCRVLGAALPARKGNARKQVAGVEIGERLCEVFEIYSACAPKSDLEFEHVVLLARGLAQGDAIAVGSCTNCQGTILIDLLATRRHVCSHCVRDAGNASAERDELDNNKQSGGADNQNTSGVQTELF